MDAKSRARFGDAQAPDQAAPTVRGSAAPLAALLGAKAAIALPLPLPTLRLPPLQMHADDLANKVMKAS